MSRASGFRAFVLIGILLIPTACSTSSGGDPPPVSPAAVTTSTTTTVATTSTTTTSTTTTTTIPPTTTSTTTTTTVPSLDRSDQATAGRMQADLAVLLTNGPRVSGTPAEADAAEYFGQTAAGITGAPSTEQPVPLPNGLTSANVWAAEVGSGDRLLLIGAHLDTWTGSPGADDNGSGVVIVLELLRRLVEDPPSNLRVVVVGFGAEERIGGSGHHFGSRLAAAEMEATGTLPDLMLSVDMAGMGDQLYSVHLDGYPADLADEVVVASTGTGIDVARKGRGEISDHSAFTRAGVPAALLMRGDNPDYHKPGDDTVSDAAVLGTLRVVEALVDHLDRIGQRPEPRPIDAFPTRLGGIDGPAARPAGAGRCI